MVFPAEPPSAREERNGQVRSIEGKEYTFAQRYGVEKKEGPFWAPLLCCRDALRLYWSSSSTTPLENTMFSKVRFRLLLVKTGMMLPG